MFKYVLIPAEESAPLQELTADKAGGLTDDALIQHAKSYFYELTGAKSRVDTLTKASPQERALVAGQIRSQMGDQVKNMDDGTLLDMVERHQTAQATNSCDITALTVPVAGNQNRAVSLYVANQGKESGLRMNARATAILTACGHSALSGGVFGDAFLGRAHDDERADIWERVDFTLSDASPTAEWCRVARSPSGGGGTGGKAAASSLSGLLQQQQPSNSNHVQVVDGSSAAGVAEAACLYGSNGAPAVQESWGCWTQTGEEVELVFIVAPGTKGKDCKVQFHQTSIGVVARGTTILHKSSLFDPVVPDDCTFTIQDAKDGNHRELIVTLTKAEPRTWSWAVHSNESSS